MNASSQSVEEWRKDIQEYIPQILDYEQPDGKAINVLCDQELVSVDHRVPEWNQSAEEWTGRRELWQVDPETRDRLAEIEQMCTEGIDWPKYENIDLKTSLNMLERPLVPSTFRILPKWSLQDRARKLPVMPMPKVGNMSKDLSCFRQDSLEATGSGMLIDNNNSDPRIAIEPGVYEQLSVLDSDPFERRVDAIKLPPVTQLGECFAQSILTQEQLRADDKKDDLPSFSSIDEYLLEYQSADNSLSKSTPDEETTDQAPMAVDPLASIRRVNDYSGSRRPLDGFFMDRPDHVEPAETDSTEQVSPVPSYISTIPEFQPVTPPTRITPTPSKRPSITTGQPSHPWMPSVPGSKQSQLHAIVPDRHVLSPGLRSLAYPAHMPNHRPADNGRKHEQWKLAGPSSSGFSAEAHVNNFVAMRKLAQSRRSTSNTFCELQGLVEKHQLDE
ncbi:hypothetical protein BJV82DRAFT_574142 [Fennellomyces sp. T-0311]|nr:hypothetical protein BJV82DRAFT_574142 [Fennellomyces sp. T-0311]